MRLAITFLMLSGLVVTGSALAQPSGAAKSGTVALSPNNCGTPYEAKPCGGKAAVTKTSAKPAPSHKAMSHTKTS